MSKYENFIDESGLIKDNPHVFGCDVSLIDNRFKLACLKTRGVIYNDNKLQICNVNHIHLSKLAS